MAPSSAPSKPTFWIPAPAHSKGSLKANKFLLLASRTGARAVFAARREVFGEEGLQLAPRDRQAACELAGMCQGRVGVESKRWNKGSGRRGVGFVRGWNQKGGKKGLGHPFCANGRRGR